MKSLKSLLRKNLQISVLCCNEPILSDESILAIVREVEEPVEVESDEEDGDDTIEVNDKCLEKATSIE